MHDVAAGVARMRTIDQPQAAHHAANAMRLRTVRNVFDSDIVGARAHRAVQWRPVELHRRRRNGSTGAVPAGVIVQHNFTIRLASPRQTLLCARCREADKSNRHGRAQRSMTACNAKAMQQAVHPGGLRMSDATLT